MQLADLTDQAVRRIREVSTPCRIILFGSAARGNMGPDSDLDMLVVVPNGSHRRVTAQRIYRQLADLGFAVDVVVVTEEDVSRYADTQGMVIGTALSEGRDLYVA